jgi:negative regulator of flagellin synthesis FlgM
MKIDSSYNPALTLNTNTKSSGAKTTSKSSDTPASEVKLSELASTLSSSSNESTPINSAKIAELRQAIASGQFKINAGAIADRLVDTAKELIQSQRRA